MFFVLPMKRRTLISCGSFLTTETFDANPPSNVTSEQKASPCCLFVVFSRVYHCQTVNEKCLIENISPDSGASCCQDETSKKNIKSSSIPRITEPFKPTPQTGAREIDAPAAARTSPRVY
ncbi:hypothetical protein NHH88_27245 [Oxalobacteraceae bacterium OTU3CAMAD1]|nr:hypothetical protein NHH88_27245 [Oxalobacteraceae bacterium OTU3CAMAD1]